jgi:hypothetical protein
MGHIKVNLERTIYNHISMGLTNNGNRSSTRTNKLHNDILDYVKTLIPNFDKKYNVFMEKNIKCAYGNYFKIDIVIEDKKGNVLVCILIKAFISSVQKNRANNANTTQGEIFRIRGVAGRETVKIWFINLIASSTPSYKLDGSLRNMESTQTSYIDLSKMENRDNIYHSTITYDLVNVDYTTKTNFKNTLLIDNIQNVNEGVFIDHVRQIF